MAAASSSSSLQRLLRRSLSARVASTLRRLQTPSPPPQSLSPLYQPHVVDGLPSKIPLLDPLWGLPTRTENATRPRVPPPVFPSYPFGLYLGPILPSGSSVASEEEAVDSSGAIAVWADSVKKKRKRKMNKHKYKKLRKRLRRQT